MAYASMTDEVIGNALPVPSSQAYPAASDIFGGGMDSGAMSGVAGAAMMSTPWGAGIMAGSQVLGSALASDPSSRADSVFDTALAFDNSGWNVSIGGGQITSDRTQSQPLAPNWILIAGLAVAGLIAWKIYNKKR